ncbi:hypothetical protein [Streptomyces xanthophaeus]|uniref:hypothetical protein n=1 Tax=Streptomyces xanthophaeus TaxID=67385 RepID=UPI00264749C0|nr:hypothetical protein [Streptomyces xanthophaeus]WKD31348.1 hypothetical protein KO717_04850 [Streptomyces xanthophaeus]
MTAAVHTEFASPVSLLRAWQERPDKAPLREFLVLGFTTDLPFLEAVAVPVARALGARVAILGDAGHALHEAVDVRQAGRGYLHGVASCHGAFHPKLALLLGDDACRVAIGSGNPTQSGWGTNDELWTVVATDGTASHPLLADLADWLEELPDAVAMTPWWEEHLRHIAGLLTELHCEAPALDTEGTDVRLVHNLHRPLLDQLPAGPVDELRLYAPFVDPSGEMLRLLRDRLSPADVTLGLQRRWSDYDAGGVRHAFAGHPAARVRELAETRMRHGKLIEWRTGDRWHALTGSPNLTRAALGRAVGDAPRGAVDGPARNCELAVLASGTSPLLPDEGPTTPVPELTGSTTATRGRAGAPPALVLLGVRADGLALEAVLGRCPAGVEVSVELSSDGGAPGSWATIGRIPADRHTATFLLPAAPPGAAVRATCRLADGTYVESAVAFLYSAERCAPRGATDAGPRLFAGCAVDDLFRDAVAARRFEQDIARLRELFVTDAAGRPTQAGGASPTVADCRRTLGTELTEVAFGPLAMDLPQLPQLPQAPVAQRWQISEYLTVDDEDEDEAGEAGFDTEADVEGGPSALPDSAREYSRRWMSRLARRLASEAEAVDKAAAEAARRGRQSRQGQEGDAEPGARPRPRPWSVPTTLLVAALHLQLLAAGAWDENDYGWRAVTADLLRALTAVDRWPADAYVPEEQGQRLDAVIAVHMSLLGLHGEIEGPDAEPVAATAWKQSRTAVARAQPDRAADLYMQTGLRGAPVATEADVEALAKRARAVPDPVAEAHRALAVAHLSATYEAGVWELAGEFSNPQAACAKAVTVLAGLPDGLWPGPVLARARGQGTRVPCFMAWHRPVLVRQRGAQWTSFRVPAPATPSATFHSGAPRPAAQGEQARRDLGPLLTAADLDPLQLFLHLNGSPSHQVAGSSTRSRTLIGRE